MSLRAVRRLLAAGLLVCVLLGSQTASAEGPPTLGHLPSWLQVVSITATLYSSDADSAARTGLLSRYAYLRVLAAGRERLHVQVYDLSSAPGATGWVDPDDVAPSAPGVDWLVSAQATTLTHEDGTAAALDPFTPLQQVDGPVSGQLEVHVYQSDFSRVADQGWVSAAETGPALAPQTLVPSPAGDELRQRSPLHPASSSDAHQAFLGAVEPVAIAARAETGVPASVTVAQAILESDWGQSSLAIDARNYFGVKALGGLGNDGVVWLPTSEYDADGQAYQTSSPFRAYKSLSDSTMDHDRLLTELSRYAPAMAAAQDPRQFAELLSEGGYSTDPSYSDKLIALMDAYDLYALDG